MFNYLFIFLGVIIFSILVGVSTFFIIESIHPRKEIRRGCGSYRWGCCPDGMTPKYDIMGSNCILES